MRFSKLAGTLVLSVLAVLAFQSEAESHGRPRFYRHYRYYPSWPYWGGYYAYPAFYYGGFYGAPYPYSRIYYGSSDRAPSALRIEVKPVEAEVYVDGYLAGSVDEFDGFFQRLNLASGAHEVVVYLDGYRTIREKLYLSPGASYKLRRAMEPLRRERRARRGRSPRLSGRSRSNRDPSRPSRSRGSESSSSEFSLKAPRSSSTGSHGLPARPRKHSSFTFQRASIGSRSEARTVRLSSPMSASIPERPRPST